MTKEEFKELILDGMKEDKRTLIALDGRCAAGKTTLAAWLSAETGCSVFHMDDFFLRPGQRTKERYAQPGGNVDRERFREEILLPLREGADEGKVRAYDCRSGLLKPPVSVRAGRVCLIEGAYCCHPELWELYDLHVFLDISPEEQEERIFRRNGREGLATFKERWIPLEEAYFQAFGIKERCDIRLDQTYCIRTA